MILYRKLYKGGNMEKIKSSAILIKKLALEFDKIAIPILTPYDLTPSQFKIIKYILFNQGKEIRQRDIEVAFSMTNPTVTGILQNLEKSGWIERVENANDARSKIIKLTPKTLKQKEKLYSLGEELEDKFTNCLNDKEQKELNELLNKLFDSIKGGNL